MVKISHFYEAQWDKNTYHVKDTYAENNLRKQKLSVPLCNYLFGVFFWDRQAC